MIDQFAQTFAYYIPHTTWQNNVDWTQGVSLGVPRWQSYNIRGCENCLSRMQMRGSLDVKDDGFGWEQGGGWHGFGSVRSITDMLMQQWRRLLDCCLSQ